MTHYARDDRDAAHDDIPKGVTFDAISNRRQCKHPRNDIIASLCRSRNVGYRVVTSGLTLEY